MSKKTVVAHRNLLLRINRALKNSGGGLVRFNRAGPGRGQGSYIRIDSKNNVADENVSMTKLAKELGVLKPWETTE